MTMRVLVLTHRLPLASHAGDRGRAYHVLRYLSRHASVDLLSLADGPAEAQAAASLPAKRVTVVRTTPWRNRLRSALRLPTSKPFTHSLLDSPGLEAALADMVRSSQPDVVLAYCGGIAGLALTEPLKHIPLIVDMSTVDSTKWSALSRASVPPLSWIHAREARCVARFEAELVAQARTTLVANARDRDTLARACPRADLTIVGNGIDLEHFRPSAHVGRGEPTVVFCGVMNYQPNEEAALRLVREIWPKVRAERPDARLLIVGAQPTQRLRQAAERDATVEVTGAVPDVRPYLWNAAVSAVPLTTSRGVQNKVLEALAADLPVVTTPAVAAGLPDDVLPGCLVAKDDTESAAAILWLLGQSPMERRALARQAELSELGWTKQLARLLPILTAAARRKPYIRLAS